MKKRLLPLLFTLISCVMISSTSVYAQFGSIPVGGTEGTCTFMGTFTVTDLSNPGALEANGVLAGTIIDHKGTATTSDDVPTSVNQAVTVAISFDGTTCTTINLSTEGLGITSSCGNISLDFTDIAFTPTVSGGGRSNLITNSLCSIARYYDNGMKASPESLYAHVKNLIKALQH